MNRRGFLTACIATCTAPMIVRASILMPLSTKLLNDSEWLGTQRWADTYHGIDRTPISWWISTDYQKDLKFLNPVYDECNILIGWN